MTTSAFSLRPFFTPPFFAPLLLPLPFPLFLTSPFTKAPFPNPPLYYFLLQPTTSTTTSPPLILFPTSTLLQPYFNASFLPLSPFPFTPFPYFSPNRADVLVLRTRTTALTSFFTSRAGHFLRSRFVVLPLFPCPLYYFLLQSTTSMLPLYFFPLLPSLLPSLYPFLRASPLRFASRISALRFAASRSLPLIQRNHP